MTPDPDGVLVVDKPAGPTSHDIVAAARRALGTRRIGHTGKEYRATLRFGIETDSYDATGRIVRETGRMPDAAALAAALEPFRGTREQVPPPYSAKKLGGTPAYELARRSAAVVLAPVRVTVGSLELASVNPPCATVTLTCSAGFYVRSLARDLGEVLGTGAILEELTRTRAGSFSLEDALPFEQLVTAARHVLRARLIPLEGLLLDLPAARVTAEAVRRVAHGQELRPADFAVDGGQDDGRFVRLVAPDLRLLGLAKPAKMGGFLRPVVVFGLE